MLVEGSDLPLWGMEIDTEREKERFKAWSAGGCDTQPLPAPLHRISWWPLL
jgi:hypothetical protein